MSEFGEFARFMREAAGLSLVGMAAKLECSRSQVFRIEQGKVEYSPKWEMKIRTVVKSEIRRKREEAGYELECV